MKKRLLFSLSFLLILGTSLLKAQTVINTYTKVTAFSCAGITVTSSVGYNVGDTVLLIQMKGADIDNTSNNPAFGSILNYNEAGNYEFNYIKSINGNLITLKNVLVKNYNPAGLVQLIRVPTFINYTVPLGLTAAPWNGNTGGVLVFLVSGTVTMNSNIDVSGLGFRGGALSQDYYLAGACSEMNYFYTVASMLGGRKGEGIAEYGLAYEAGRGALANGGGGGNYLNAGGSGGSNYAQSGRGGDQWGGCPVIPIGGEPAYALNYSNAINKIFLAGGGGGGHQNNTLGTSGTNGGGIIIIKANTIVGNGNSILSNGLNVPLGAEDGAGGGGAGGTILMDVLNYTGNLNINVKGGSGGSSNTTGHGTGGGGSGGLVWLSSATLPVTMFPDLLGGLPGVQTPGDNYGADTGGTGGILYNLKLVESSVPVLSTTIISGPSTLCNGNNITLTAGGVGTYSWNTGATTSAITVSPVITSTYTVTVTSPAGCTATAEKIITLNPPVDVNITPAAASCGNNNGSASATGSGGTAPYTYLWNNGGTTQTISGLSSGTYTVTVTDSQCIPSGIELIANGNFEAGNTGFTSGYPYCTSGACMGPNSYSVGNTPSSLNSGWTNCADHTSGSGNYLIVDGATTAGTNMWCQTITVSPNTNYSFSAWVSGLYPLELAHVEVYISGIFIDSVTASSSTCAWKQLSATWNSGGNTSINICLVNKNIASNGNDFIIDDISFQECLHCSKTDTVTINRISMVTVTTGTVPTTCGGSDGSASVTASGGTPGYTYNWSNGQSTQTSTGLSAGTYTITVTDAGSCQSSATIQIAANPLPVITVAGATICEGDSTVLKANGASTYTWSPATGLSNIAGTTVTASPTATTTYIVTGTRAGCTSSTTVIVTVNLKPKPTISGSNSVCQGAGTTLTASGGATYTWGNGATTTSITVSPSGQTTYTVTADTLGCKGQTTVTVSIIPPPSPTITGITAICIGGSTTLTATAGGTYAWNTGETTTSITVTPATTTSYTVIVTNICSSIATVQVTVQSGLTPTITGTPTICNGTSTTLSTSGGGTYSWSNGSTTSSITVSPTINTTYSVTVTNGLCTGTAEQPVIVNQNPTPVIAGNTTICNGQTTTLTTGTGGTYVWNTGGTTTAITVSPTSSTSYTVIVTTNGCSGFATALVTVNQIPEPIITGIASICTGQSTTLTSSTAGPYSWNTGATSASVTVSPTITSTYSVSVTQNGCIGTGSYMVTVTPPVIASVTGNDICEGESVTLTASGGTSYLWSTSETNNPIIVSPLNTTTYTVIVAVGNCTDTATYTVIVNPLPIPIVTGDATISYGNSTPLTASGGGTYQWVPASGLSCSNCANPIATPLATTQYCVIITDTAGCNDSACVTVTIDLKCGDNGELYVPNGFSPNGDGQNDVLYVRGGGSTDIFWVIYDRWGEKIFETTDPKHGWDGTYKGKELDPAVFVFYLKVTCFSGEEIIQKGNVAIIR